MAEFVNLKPRVTIQTVIHFDCPDRASFFAEYSRQLRRGEIFLEVAQKIPVGTRVEVHFQFQDCESTVDLAGEIYRHRRKLDRLEAAVQFLDPEALQKLLRLSEDDLGPLDEEVKAGKRRYRPEDVERPEQRAPTLAEADEQDTTKILVLPPGPAEGPAELAPADPVPEPAPAEGPPEPAAEAVPAAWQRALEITAAESEQAEAAAPHRAEDEELEATKSMPSWGAHWLGLNEAPPTDAQETPPEAAPEAPQAAEAPVAATQAAPEQETPAGEWTAEEALEVEEIADQDDAADAWFDLSEPQVAELLRHADSRPGYPARPVAPPAPRREPPAATVPAPKDEIDSWLETLTPAPPRPSGRIPEEALIPPSAAGTPAPPGESEPETILDLEEELGPGPAVPEPDLDLDDWDWDFLQSPPKPDEPAQEVPEPSPERDEEIFAEFMRRHVAEPASDSSPETSEPGAADAEPVYFDMSGEPEPPPRQPVKTAWEELDEPWEEPSAPWDKPVQAEPKDRVLADALDSNPGGRRLTAPLGASAPVPAPDSSRLDWKESGTGASAEDVPPIAPSEAGSGEWPVEEPFRAATSEAGDAEQEPDEEMDAVEVPRSGVASRIGVLAVILVLLGGTTAVVLEPAWFSGLLGGSGPGEEPGTDPEGLPEPTATVRATIRKGLIPDPLAVDATPTTAMARQASPVPPTKAAASSLTRIPTIAATSGAASRRTPTTVPPSPTSKPFVPEVIDLEPEGTKPPAVALVPSQVVPPTKPSLQPVDTPTAQRVATPEPPTPAQTPRTVSTPAGTPAETPAAATLTLVTGVQVDASPEKVELRLQTEGKVGRILRSEAFNPPRLIFDLLETSARSPLAGRPVGQRGIERIRFGVHADKLRIVLDLLGPAPTVETEALDGVVILRTK